MRKFVFVVICINTFRVWLILILYSIDNPYLMMRIQTNKIKTNNRKNKKIHHLKTIVTSLFISLKVQAIRVLLLRQPQWILRSHTTPYWFQKTLMKQRRFTDLKDKWRDTQAQTSQPLTKESKPPSPNISMVSVLTNTSLPSLSACHLIRIKDSTWTGYQNLRSLLTNEHERNWRNDIAIIIQMHKYGGGIKVMFMAHIKTVFMYKLINS